MVKRIILYHINGKPVYADQVMPSASKEEDKKDDFWWIRDDPMFNYDPTPDTDDPDKPNKPDKPGTPDNKPEKPKKKAKRVLVRGKDGQLNVRYIDLTTGKAIPPNKLKLYEFVTGSNAPYYSPTKVDDTETDEDEDKTDDKTDEEEEEDRFGPPGQGIDTGTNGSKSGYTGNVGNVNPNPVSPDTLSSRDSTTDDPGIGDSDNPDTTDNGPSKTGDWTYSNGTDFSPYTGMDINSLSVDTMSNRSAYTPDDFTAMGKTLAGEIDFSKTDLSTDEGRKEAYGILSTMENRDLANGDKKGIQDAIYSPNQYSTWNDDKGKAIAEANYSKNKDQIDAIVGDYMNDPKSNMGFTSYYNPSIANPDWGKQMKDVQDIGPHKFGSLPEYTSKIAKEELDDDQKDQIVTGIINDNKAQDWTNPASDDITANKPDEFMTQEEKDAKDKLGMDYSGINLDPNAVPSWTPGWEMNEAKDDINNMVDNQLDEAGWQVDAGKDIASNPPDVPSPDDYSPTGWQIDAGKDIAAAPPAEFAPNIDVDKSSFDSSYISADPGPTVDVDKTGFDSGYITGNLDSRMGPETALGFGDQVTTDQAAASPISGFALDRAEQAINDSVDDPGHPADKGWAATIGEQMANTAPDVDTTGVDTSASDTAGTDSSQAGPSTSGDSPGADAGTSGYGGFADVGATSTDGTGSTGSTGTGVNGDTSGTDTSGFADPGTDSETGDTSDTADDGGLGGWDGYI